MPWSPKRAIRFIATTSSARAAHQRISHLCRRPPRLGRLRPGAALKAQGYRNLLLRTREELDLTEQLAVRAFLRARSARRPSSWPPRVSGAFMPTTPSRPQFIRDNLLIQDNVIDSAYRTGVGKLVFLGSSCIYPKLAPQPIKEEYLLTGPLEPTNEWYAIAKIAGVKMCQAFRREFGFKAISLMPTNLYGPGDNFDLQRLACAAGSDPPYSRGEVTRR